MDKDKQTANSHVICRPITGNSVAGESMVLLRPVDQMLVFILTGF